MTPPTRPLDPTSDGSVEAGLVRLQRFSAIVAVAWGVFTLLHFTAGRPWLAVIHLGAFVVVGAGAWVARTEHPMRDLVVLPLVAGGSFVALMVVSVMTGGTDAPAMGYLSLLPLVTGLFTHPRVRQVWLAVGLLGIALVPLLTPQVPVVLAMEATTLERVLSALALAILLYGFGSEWRASSEAQVALLEARRRTIEEQAREVRAAHDQAVRASEQKSRFVAMTSHELRGPLNGILGMSDALADTRLGDHQRQLVRALSTSAGALSRLLSDLLDVARIEAGRLDVVLGPTDVRELMADVVDAFAPEASAKGLDIAATAGATVPREVQADGGRLGQVLRNLVSNAVKFTDTGSVTLEATRAGDVLELVVRDTGKGMEPDAVARIFVPFEQVSADLVDRRAGTGLGLWIARNLVESWGGKIEVESVLAGGTAFRLSMPLDGAPRSSRHNTVPGLPMVTVVTARPVTARAFESVAREIEARLTVHASAEALLGGGRIEARAVIVDVETCEASTLAALGDLGIGERLIFASSASRMAEAERSAGRCGARVLLMPVRASRLLAALASTARDAGRGADETPSSLEGTVLVVDDDAINRTVARHAAEQLGLRVLEADSGEKALSMLQVVQVDVVLLDLHMEGIGGDETAIEIRSRLGSAAPAMIAYTGTVQEGDRRRLKDAGAEEILGKPLDRAAFAAAMGRALAPRRRRSRRGLTALAAVPFDPAALVELEKIMGSASAVIEMLAEFIPQLGARVTTIASAIEAGELPPAGATSHALASSSATFGALEVAAIARALEPACRNQNREHAAYLAQKLVDAEREVAPLLTQRVAASREPGGVPGMAPAE